MNETHPTLEELLKAREALKTTSNSYEFELIDKLVKAILASE